MALVKKRIRLLSIDPSINNLGMAIWDVGSKELLLYKLVHPEIGHRQDEYKKSLSMLNQLKTWIQVYGVNRMMMEIPEHWAVAGFAARETGSIAKLMFVCGLLYSLVQELEEVKLVTPRGWKGQLSKEVVANRLQDHYIPLGVDLTKIDANVADAIEMGHFYLYGCV